MPQAGIERRVMLAGLVGGTASAALGAAASTGLTEKVSQTMPTAHRFINIGNLNLFYREAGPPDAPVVLLLHGYPSSSFMFRQLIALEAHLCEIGALMRDFLAQKVPA